MQYTDWMIVAFTNHVNSSYYRIFFLWKQEFQVDFEHEWREAEEYKFFLKFRPIPIFHHLICTYIPFCDIVNAILQSEAYENLAM